MAGNVGSALFQNNYEENVLNTILITHLIDIGGGARLLFSWDNWWLMVSLRSKKGLVSWGGWTRGVRDDQVHL